MEEYKNNLEAAAGEDTLYDISSVASMTECTGLTPAAVNTEEDSQNYGELYGVHQLKPEHIRKRMGEESNS